MACYPSETKYNALFYSNLEGGVGGQVDHFDQETFTYYTGHVQNLYHSISNILRFRPLTWSKNNHGH